MIATLMTNGVPDVNYSFTLDIHRESGQVNVVAVTLPRAATNPNTTLSQLFADFNAALTSALTGDLAGDVTLHVCDGSEADAGAGGQWAHDRVVVQERSQRGAAVVELDAVEARAGGPKPRGPAVAEARTRSRVRRPSSLRSGRRLSPH